MAVVQSNRRTARPQQARTRRRQILRGPRCIADEFTASASASTGPPCGDGIVRATAADGDLQVKRPDLLTMSPTIRTSRTRWDACRKRNVVRTSMVTKSSARPHAATLVGQQDGPGLPRDMIDDVFARVTVENGNGTIFPDAPLPSARGMPVANSCAPPSPERGDVLPRHSSSVMSSRLWVY